MIVFQTLYSQTAEPLENDVLRPQELEYAFPEGEKESGKLVLYTKGKMILKKLWDWKLGEWEPHDESQENTYFKKQRQYPSATINS